jgi:hypothetical protein
MKVFGLNVDWADVGNACLILGTGFALYGAGSGNVLFAAEAMAVGGALKGVASAVDNYLFKKAQAAKAA